MKRILIHRHPDCEKCARFARVHHWADWLNRVADTTATPRTGPLRRGEIVVEDRATGRILAGADALVLICRQIPLYWPFLPLLRIPALRARADADLRGAAGDFQNDPHVPGRPDVGLHP